MQCRIAPGKTVLLLVAAGLVACTPAPRSQIAGSASVTVDGKEEKMHVVKCSQRDWFLTIKIGGDFAGATVVVDERTPSIAAQSVHIQNMGGFTGRFSQGGGGQAKAGFNGDTYTVIGTASGYKTDKSNEPTTAEFKIVADC